MAKDVLVRYNDLKAMDAEVSRLTHLAGRGDRNSSMALMVLLGDLRKEEIKLLEASMKEIKRLRKELKK